MNSSMPQLKVLIVSAVFYPRNSPRAHRTTELSLELARQGHLVTVITNCSEEVRQQFAADYGITILPLNSSAVPLFEPGQSGWKGKVKNGINRLLSLFFDYPNILHMPRVKRLLRKFSGFDILISLAYPHSIHWGVAAARTGRNSIARVWVADCGDPYMGLESDSFKPPFYFRFLEQWFCRKADYITVPFSGAIDGYYPQFREKIRVISQGFRFPEISPALPVRGNRVPRFIFGGLMIPGFRDPREFLTYLVNLPTDYQFDIYTPNPALIIPFAEASRQRIRIHPVLPRERFLKELRKADFVVNFEYVSKRQAPSKLIDYAMMQKPILSLRASALDTKTIDAFLQGDYSGGLVIDDPDQYRIENVCKKFVALAQA